MYGVMEWRQIRAGWHDLLTIIWFSCFYPITSFDISMRRIAPTHTTSNPKSKWVCQKLYAQKIQWLTSLSIEMFIWGIIA